MERPLVPKTEGSSLQPGAAPLRIGAAATLYLRMNCLLEGAGAGAVSAGGAEAVEARGVVEAVGRTLTAARDEASG